MPKIMKLKNSFNKQPKENAQQCSSRICTMIIITLVRGCLCTVQVEQATILVFGHILFLPFFVNEWKVFLPDGNRNPYRKTKSQK